MKESAADRIFARTMGVLCILVAVLTEPAAAQVVPPDVEDILVVSRGHSVVVSHPAVLDRVLITDPEIADALAVAPQEVVVNGVRPGSTTLLIWGEDGSRATYSVRVHADVSLIQEELLRALPEEDIRVSAAGNMIILQGAVVDPRAAARALALVESLGNGADVADHLAVPDPGQVLLQVRLAEVNRSAMQELGIHLLRIDPRNVRGDDEAAVGARGVVPFTGSFLGGTGPDQTFSDAVNFYLFHESANVSALVQALRAEGLFRSLAEPNLIAVPGEEASFLAGGDFPFPVIQPATGTATVEFREFGIRLNFIPHITNSGAIRLDVAPEVSQLDFAGGVEIAGTRIPTVLSRRAHTVVELEEGQTFAIAGLIDQVTTTVDNRIPILGDIPILGALFRSQEQRQEKTELLVLVTPHFVRADFGDPPLPTGDPADWDWFPFMRDAPPADSTGAGAGQQGGDDEQPDPR